MIIEDTLQGEPPSKAIWYEVKRDENDNPVMFPQTRSKWIVDNIALLHGKYERLSVDQFIDVEIHYVTRSHKRTSELLRAFEYILCRVFIYSADQIRNVHITKELSVPNDKEFKACIHNFTIKIV